MEQHRTDIAPAQQGWSTDETIDQLRQHHESPDLVEAFQSVVKLAQIIKENGGRSFLVGGAVRDELLHQPPHDLDIEVHGLPQDKVEELLRPFGSTDMTGKSFATYKFHVGKSEVQIALPRTEVRTGIKHNTFTVTAHPEYGITEAAWRRDFTIGAISKDVLTGEIFDPFHGIEDLDNKILRMVDEKTFGEDPLRVLRGARFAAKFELTAEPKTREVMRSMIEQIGALPKERLREEWLRLLTEAERPSQGIELLREIGLIDRWHPELAKLWQTPQDTKYHPEGTAGAHTMLAVDAAATLTREHDVRGAEQQEIILGALVHDIGKPLVTTTDDDGVHSINHEAAGVKPAETFLTQIGIPVATQERIVIHVAEHMRPAQLYSNRDQITDRALRKLVHDVGAHALRPLIIVAEADHRGRGPFTMPNGEQKFPDTAGYHAWWEEQIARLELDTPPEPLLWGRDLMERGWKQGRHIGEVLRLVQELAIQGVQREQIIELLNQHTDPEKFAAALNELRTT